MNKYHRSTKNPQHSINALHNHLFGKLQEIQPKNNSKVNVNDQFFAEFEQASTPYSQQVLQKAKKVTYSNKGKIEQMRKQIKKMEEAESADFVTGVGLYIPEEQPQQMYQDFDEESLMRNLRDTKYDDLAELRRMIKRTEHNLKQYSQSVYNTQNQIVSAADKYGREIDVGLAIKINRCGLDRTHSKVVKSKGEFNQTDGFRRRTMSSNNPVRKRG